MATSLSLWLVNRVLMKIKNIKCGGNFRMSRGVKITLIKLLFAPTYCYELAVGFCSWKCAVGKEFYMENL